MPSKQKVRQGGREGRYVQGWKSLLGYKTDCMYLEVDDASAPIRQLLAQELITQEICLTAFLSEKFSRCMRKLSQIKYDVVICHSMTALHTDLASSSAESTSSNFTNLLS